RVRPAGRRASGAVRVPDALWNQARVAGPAGGRWTARASLRPVRDPVVSVPHAADGRASCEHVVLRIEPAPRSGLRGAGDSRRRAMRGGGMNERSVAFLGGGRMGEALASGLIRSGGRSVDELIISCRREARAAGPAAR